MAYETEVPGTAVQPSPGPPRSRREEIRRDRIARAQIEREKEAARLQAQQARFEMAGARRQARAEARLAARAGKRAARAEVLAKAAGWAGEHRLDLMFTPVIGVPAWLSWDAMSMFGYELYGGPGRALPVLSETAMWIFEFAIAEARRRDKHARLWPLYLGMIFFALICATLNFLHGLTGPIPGTVPPGTGAGAVYALVSVSGIIAHQIVSVFGRSAKAARGATRKPADGAAKGATRQTAALPANPAHVAPEGREAAHGHGTAAARQDTGKEIPGIPQSGPDELSRRGGTRQAMREYWDKRTAEGHTPNGAELNRAIGKHPKYSLGKRYASEWRAETGNQEEAREGNG